MKLTCLQENLNQALSIVTRIASSTKSNLPILNNILLDIENNSLKLIATNLEIAVEVEIRAKTKDIGKITIPAQVFSNYINLLPKDSIDLEIEKNELTIQTKYQKAKIKGISAEEFPVIPKVDKKEKIVLETQNFKQAIKQTVFAISSSETRAEISGALLTLDGKTLTLVGTDSYRLTEKKIKVKETDYQGGPLIIPKKTLEEVAKIIEDKDSSVKGEELVIYPSANQILFTYQRVNLISQIISGDYPDYKEIIPTKFKTKAIFAKNALLQMVRATSFFTKSGVNDLNLKFLSKENKIVAFSLNNQVGESRAELEADVAGDNNQISVNYQYLLDGLLNLPGEELSLEVIDSNLPGLIKSISDSSFLYIIMPIKTS